MEVGDVHFFVQTSDCEHCPPPGRVSTLEAKPSEPDMRENLEKYTCTCVQNQLNVFTWLGWVLFEALSQKMACMLDFTSRISLPSFLARSQKGLSSLISNNLIFRRRLQSRENCCASSGSSASARGTRWNGFSLLNNLCWSICLSYPSHSVCKERPHAPKWIKFWKFSKLTLTPNRNPSTLVLAKYLPLSSPNGRIHRSDDGSDDDDVNDGGGDGCDDDGRAVWGIYCTTSPPLTGKPDAQQKCVNAFKATQEMKIIWLQKYPFYYTYNQRSKFSAVKCETNFESI